MGTKVQVPKVELAEIEAHDADVEVLDKLLNQEFRPRTEVARETVQDAVRALAEHVVQDEKLLCEDAVQTIQAVISRLDDILSKQLNAIIHNKEFQRLEGSWRGLAYLVENTKTSSKMKIKVLNVSKQELGKNLKSYRGVTWDQSPFFKRIYEEEFGQFGGEPFGALIGDYQFDHSHTDVEMLTAIARVSSAAHCPFISAAAPSVMQLDSWDDLSRPQDLGNIFTTPDYSAWRRLRESPDSRYIALTLPRFASRVPYGRFGDQLDTFNFEESLEDGPEDVLWSNAAYAMGVNVNRAFTTYGWCSNIRGIESGGAIDGLPTLRYRNEQGVDMYGSPTEISISDRREAELSRAGFMPLVYCKNSDIAAFIGARSVHQPKEYEDAASNDNAELSTRLPYVFGISRFAHYLKCIARDKVGSLKNRADIQRWLSDWIVQYVDGDPAISSEATKARRPLAEAEVKVEEVPGEVGYYRTVFYLRPHFQLEGLTVSLRLVGKIPAGDTE